MNLKKPITAHRLFQLLASLLTTWTPSTGIAASVRLALMPSPCSFVGAFLTVLLSSLAVMPVRCQRGEGQLNIYGRALALCSRDPMTGWYRDGYARTDQFDHGSHVGETPHFLFFKTVTYILHTLHSGFFYKNTPNQLSLSTFSILNL